MAIYLDYAATTPVRPEVVEAITSSLSQLYGNPSSTYQLGKSAKYALNQARLGRQKLITGLSGLRLKAP